MTNSISSSSSTSSSPSFSYNNINITPQFIAQELTLSYNYEFFQSTTLADISKGNISSLVMQDAKFLEHTFKLQQPKISALTAAFMLQEHRRRTLENQAAQAAPTQPLPRVTEQPSKNRHSNYWDHRILYKKEKEQLVHAMKLVKCQFEEYDVAVPADNDVLMGKEVINVEASSTSSSSTTMSDEKINKELAEILKNLFGQMPNLSNLQPKAIEQLLRPLGAPPQSLPGKNRC